MMFVAVSWVTNQLVFDGVVNGLVIGLLAMGIVLVYRATRVINFAVGNLGLVGASLTALLSLQYDIPFWISIAVGLGVGTLFAIAVELVVIRRLFTAPRVIVLVATIGIAQLALAVVAAYPEIENKAARYPVAARSIFDDVMGLRVTGQQIAIIIVVPLLALALSWFLNRTRIGKAVTAAASNPDLARTSGISPKAVSTLVWGVAGLLSTVSLMLVAGLQGPAATIVTLGPSTLVRALAAAVFARMVSFRGALVAGLAIGVAQSIVGFNFLNQAGLIDALLLLAVLTAVGVQTRAQTRGEAQSFSFGPKLRPIPDRLRRIWWVRNIDRAGLALLFVVALVLPLIVTTPSRVLLYSTVLAFAICASSLTVLTGWAGQLSLGQMAFAGIGALTAAALTRGLSLDIGFRGLEVADIEMYGIPFWLAVPIGALVASAVAALVGLGALRVRGLLLAISTFAFAVAAQQYLYRRPVFTGGASASAPFPRGDLFGIDMSSQRSYYYAVLGVLAIVVIVLSLLRRSGVGRTTIGVRDNADTAAAYTVSPTMTKLRAFALSGAIAGLGGALLAGAVQAVPFTQRFYLVEDSLTLVAMIVIGGLGTIAGPVLGAIWVVGLPAFFPDNDLVPLFTSSLGLLILLLYFPGGLVQIGHAIRSALLDIAERRAGPAPGKKRTEPPTYLHVADGYASTGPALTTTDVTVRFGGNVAVDHASVSVGAHEIVGLIGTNGAGKSTLMNAIGGYVPATGSIELLGRDVRRLSSARRARLGLGRTFQAATLFPELTVRETVEVALESRHPSGLFTTIGLVPVAAKRERAARAEAAELIDFLGLGRYADRYIADLSTGTRRIVELAGLLALQAKVLCLDEPTAGVAQRETEAFGPLILEIRRELSASILVIEHDMPLIMSISDRVYCLEAGAVIAQGTPSVVRNDPRVIASYLGTDERAIARSGQRAAQGDLLKNS
jgi:ABC-type branched-subunit amino acid transport system ATPase component/ABC-type branched-subunit amino acid transport system permease subunit